MSTEHSYIEIAKLIGILVFILLMTFVAQFLVYHFYTFVFIPAIFAVILFIIYAILRNTLNIWYRERTSRPIAAIITVIGLIFMYSFNSRPVNDYISEAYSIIKEAAGDWRYKPHVNGKSFKPTIHDVRSVEWKTQKSKLEAKKNKTTNEKKILEWMKREEGYYSRTNARQENTIKIDSAKERFASGDRSAEVMETIYGGLKDGSYTEIPGNPSEQSYFADRLIADNIVVLHAEGNKLVIPLARTTGKPLTKETFRMEQRHGRYKNSQPYKPQETPIKPATQPEPTPSAGAAPETRESFGRKMAEPPQREQKPSGGSVGNHTTSDREMEILSLLPPSNTYKDLESKAVAAFDNVRNESNINTAANYVEYLISKSKLSEAEAAKLREQVQSIKEKKLKNLNEQITPKQPATKTEVPEPVAEPATPAPTSSAEPAPVVTSIQEPTPTDSAKLEFNPVEVQKKSLKEPNLEAQNTGDANIIPSYKLFDVPPEFAEAREAAITKVLEKHIRDKAMDEILSRPQDEQPESMEALNAEVDALVSNYFKSNQGKPIDISRMSPKSQFIYNVKKDLNTFDVMAENGMPLQNIVEHLNNARTQIDKAVNSGLISKEEAKNLINEIQYDILIKGQKLPTNPEVKKPVTSELTPLPSTEELAALAGEIGKENGLAAGIRKFDELTAGWSDEAITAANENALIRHVLPIQDLSNQLEVYAKLFEGRLRNYRENPTERNYRSLLTARDAFNDIREAASLRNKSNPSEIVSQATQDVLPENMESLTKILNSKVVGVDPKTPQITAGPEQVKNDSANKIVQDGEVVLEAGKNDKYITLADNLVNIDDPVQVEQELNNILGDIVKGYNNGTDFKSALATDKPLNHLADVADKKGFELVTSSTEPPHFERKFVDQEAPQIVGEPEVQPPISKAEPKPDAFKPEISVESKAEGPRNPGFISEEQATALENAGVKQKGDLSVLFAGIRSRLRDTANLAKENVKEFGQKILSSVPNQAKDLGKRILPASPKQTIADIIDFISTPRTPLGNGRILAPELRKKMRDVFSENAKKLEEAALSTKKEKIDLAAQSKSAFDDILKAERKRNSALQQFNEDPKIKEYNTLEDILTEAKRIFDVENNKPITLETGGNESLTQATKNLDAAESAVNNFLTANPGFAARKRAVDNTRNLFETAKHRYKDTTGESYTDILPSNNIEDVVTNGFNINTRRQRPITIDSTGNMHIPVSTEFAEGLNSGRYYGTGTGYTFNKGFLGGNPEIIVPKGKEITLKDVMNPSNQHTFNPNDVPIPDIVASKAKGGSRAGGNAASSGPSGFWSPGANLRSAWNIGKTAITTPFKYPGTLLGTGLALEGASAAINGGLNYLDGTRQPVTFGEMNSGFWNNGMNYFFGPSKDSPVLEIRTNPDGTQTIINPFGSETIINADGSLATRTGNDSAGNTTVDTYKTDNGLPIESKVTTKKGNPLKETTYKTDGTPKKETIYKEDGSQTVNETGPDGMVKSTTTPPPKDPTLGDWMTKNVVPEYFSNKENFGSYGHSLFGALAGGALGAGIGGLNYILTDENELSEEEKKKRSLARAMLSSAGIGAGIGGLVGGASDYTRA